MDVTHFWNKQREEISKYQHDILQDVPIYSEPTCKHATAMFYVVTNSFSGSLLLRAGSTLGGTLYKSDEQKFPVGIMGYEIKSLVILCTR